MDAIKTASKRAIQKTAEATGDLIVNKIADKVFRKSLQRSCTQWDYVLKNYKMTEWKHQKTMHISRRKTTDY